MTCLRKVCEDDLECIMNWRMREDITKYMYSDPVLTLEKQKEWFENSKSDRTNIHFVIEKDEMPIGVLNITDMDEKNSKCSWGYYVAVKEKRSLNLALALEWNVYDYVFDVLKLNKLEGEVFACNKAVIRMHQMCGSRIEGIRKAHIKKNGIYYDVVEMGICRDEWKKIHDNYTYEKMSFSGRMNMKCLI